MKSSTTTLSSLLLTVLLHSNTNNVGAEELNFKPLAEHRREDLSFMDFERLYSVTRTPVIIKGGVQRALNEVDWNLDTLKNKCGDQPLRAVFEIEGEELISPKHCVNEFSEELRGKAWGGLQKTDIDALNLSTIGDVIKKQEEGHEPFLYLHDCPIQLNCPNLYDHFIIPKYFPTDFRVSDPVSEYESSHTSGFRHETYIRGQGAESDEKNRFGAFPTLFIGPKGSQTVMHIDSGNTRFWFAILNGRKRWVICDADSYENLHPVNGQLSVDAFNVDYEKYPEARDANCYEGIGEPGDLIFIPENAPHQVKNLDDTIGYSYNYVDKHNFKQHIEGQYSDLMDQFEHALLREPRDPNDYTDDDKETENKLDKLNNDMKYYRKRFLYEKTIKIPGINYPLIKEPEDETPNEYIRRNSAKSILSIPENQFNSEAFNLMRDVYHGFFWMDHYEVLEKILNMDEEDDEEEEKEEDDEDMDEEEDDEDMDEEEDDEDMDEEDIETFFKHLENGDLDLALDQ